MRNGFFWAFIALCLTAGSSLGAQDAIFSMVVEDPALGAEELEAELFIDTSDPLSGWSIAVCHDEDVLTATDIENGSAFDTVPYRPSKGRIHDMREDLAVAMQGPALHGRH